MLRTHTQWLVGVLLLSCLACSDNDATSPQNNTTAADSGSTTAADVGTGTDASDTTPDAELPTVSIAENLGLTRYLDSIDPIEDLSNENETTYTFDTAQGPMCLRGDPFRTAVRDTGSDDLIIFLQGGGACWSDFCLAVTKAPKGVPRVDILNPELEINPARDWNVVYLPYCDGSFFAGDMDHDDDGDGTPERFHRGLQNLSAALVVAKTRFPAPRRILLAGSSGGAYGTLLGTALVRHLYPDVPLFVMADSGVGLGRPGDAAFLETILDEFNLRRFIPEECDGCITDGHITGIVDWYLEQDPNVHVGLFSAWYDGVLGEVFLRVSGADFRDALRTQTDRIHARHPDRFRRFIIDGVRHTTLLGDASGIIGSDLSAVELPEGAITDLLGGSLDLGSLEETELQGVNIAVWLDAMLTGDSAVWVDMQAEPGEPPY